MRIARKFEKARNTNTLVRFHYRKHKIFFIETYKYLQNNFPENTLKKTKIENIVL